MHNQNSTDKFSELTGSNVFISLVNSFIGSFYIFYVDGELNVLHDILARDGDLDPMEAEDDASIEAAGSVFTLL
jgi:hypothetical protein